MKHFRFYEIAANDPRVLGLPTDTLRWQWVAMLCTAAQHGGVLPSLTDVATGLRIAPAKAALVIAALHRAGLLEEVPGGYFRPSPWPEGQRFGSDLSTLRTMKFKSASRERSGNATSGSFRPIGEAAASVVDRLGEQRSVVIEAEAT